MVFGGKNGFVLGLNWVCFLSELLFLGEKGHRLGLFCIFLYFWLTGLAGRTKFLTKREGKVNLATEDTESTERGGFTGPLGKGLAYPASRLYSKRACAFGPRRPAKLLTLSAMVKPCIIAR